MNLTKYFLSDNNSCYGYSFKYIKTLFDRGKYRDIKLNGCILNEKILLKCVRYYYKDSNNKKIVTKKNNDCFMIQKKLNIDNYQNCSECHMALINRNLNYDK